MNIRRQVALYIVADLTAAAIAWTVLYVFRKKNLEPEKFGYDVALDFDANYFYGLLFIPVFWIMLYVAAGHYLHIFRRYRLLEFGQVLWASVVGVLFIFFVFLQDDYIFSYRNYYQSLLVLYASHFSLTLLFRLALTSRTVSLVRSGKVGFGALIVGGNERALNMYEEIRAIRENPGYKFEGFVKVNGKDDLLTRHIPFLGTYADLPANIKEKKIEDVIIAVESRDHKYLENIISLLEDSDVNINIIPDAYNIVSGSVKMNSIFGVPLIRINHELMPAWQFSIKRIIDLVFSAVALLVLLPILLVIALMVKVSSPGPVFFFQERIGKFSRPFRIIKFRTMVHPAKSNSPQLSSSNDPRVTKFGRTLRKARLDELPQFWNVIKGDMSLVGPRPERKYYIEQIMKAAPHYRLLHRVRPGITSWGQVKFGYAENVQQMLQRLKYDIFYIENMSLAMDIKILFYTILIVIKGSGI